MFKVLVVRPVALLVMAASLVVPNAQQAAATSTPLFEDTFSPQRPGWSFQSPSTGFLGELNNNDNVASVTLTITSASAGTARLEFDLLSFRTLDDATSCCTDTLTLSINGILALTGAFGDRGTDRFFSNPSGATKTASSNIGGGFTRRIFLPAVLRAGSNTLTWSYSPLQPSFDEAWGLDKVVVRAVDTLPPGLRRSAADRAKQIIGAPYLGNGTTWGGKGFDFGSGSYATADQIMTGYEYWNNAVGSTAEGAGVDCSGLVKWAYNGVDGVEHVHYEGADGQYRFNSDPIDKVELQPGDVLFFSQTGNRMSHVAMYVGNGEVVEAYDPQLGVRLTTLQEASSRSTFVSFGRITAATIGGQIRAHSPVALAVTDAQGDSITDQTVIQTDRERLREIPGELFYSEWGIDQTGRADDVVTIPVLKPGSYFVKPVPKPHAQPTDTYGLDIIASGETIILAAGASISDIPVLGYGLRVSENGEIATFTPSDTTPPSITCAMADGQWHPDNISLACTATDNGAGLRSPEDNSFFLSTDEPAGAETINAITAARNVCDLAGNCATAGPITGNMIDRRAPTLTITSPSAETYILNQRITAGYSCSDAGSGLTSCSGPVPSGSRVATSSIGAHTFTVQTTDNTGNGANHSIGYTVAYKICLLYDPTKVHKKGSTIPIKVQICDAENTNMSAPSIGLTAQGVTQTSTWTFGPIDDSGNANPDSNFRHDPTLGDTGGYIYNLSTKLLVTGTYALHFTVADSSTAYTVPFQVQ